MRAAPSARLESSPNDTPLIAEADRTLVRTGAIAAVTHQRRSHLVKSGVEMQRLALDEAFQFAVTDEDAAEDAGFSDAALEFDAGRSVRVLRPGDADDVVGVSCRTTGSASASLTISAGIRFDASHLLLDRHQWSPRIGAAHRAWRERRSCVASVSRFFQPPQPENLLLSSSEQARQLSPFAGDDEGGGAELEPERQWAAEVGVEHWLGQALRIDAAFWYRAIREVADPNVFAGTTIIFPNAVATGRARGVDVRLEMPRRNGWSGYVNASAGRVIQTGPITGGLFLEDEIGELGPGVEFVPDHDQRLVLGGGVNWEHDAHGHRDLADRPLRERHADPADEDDDDELQQRPGADLVDFERGRVKPRTVVSLLGDVPLWRSGTTHRARSRGGAESVRCRLRLQLRQPVQRHALRRAANGVAGASRALLEVTPARSGLSMAAGAVQSLRDRCRRPGRRQTGLKPGRRSTPLAW